MRVFSASLLILGSSLHTFAQAPEPPSFVDACKRSLTAVVIPQLITEAPVPSRPEPLHMKAEGNQQSILYFKATREDYARLVKSKVDRLAAGPGKDFKIHSSYNAESGIGVIASANGQAGHNILAKFYLGINETKVSRVDGNPIVILGGYRWSKTEGVEPYSSDNFPIQETLFPQLQKHIDIQWERDPF